MRIFLFLCAFGLTGVLFGQEANDSGEFLLLPTYPSRIRILSDYKKPSLILQPNDGQGFFSQKSADALGFLPNFGPNLGASVGFGSDFEVALSFAVPQWEGRVSERGKTKGYHAQVHKISDRWGADISFSDLKGFFIDRIKVGSVPLASDVLLNGDGKYYEQRPNLTYQALSLGGYYFLFENSHATLKYLPTAVQTGLLWTPLVASELFLTRFSNDTPFIPTDDQARFGTSAVLTGGTTESLTVQAGAVANWNTSGYLWMVSAAWGPSINKVRFAGVDTSERFCFGNSGKVTGGLTRIFNESQFAGLRGTKNVRTYSTSDLILTDAISYVELFLGQNL